MDCNPVEEIRHTVIDIQSCCVDTSNQQVGSQAFSDDDKTVPCTICDSPMIVVENKNKDSQSTVPSIHPVIINAEDHVSNESSGKKNNNKKSLNAKKPPKPPRPPRGLSLDAADQKLIKEIAELAMIKRAKIERMRAFKRMKAAKASSASSSASGNLMAILFTIVFCVMFILQGCHSSLRHGSGVSSSQKSNNNMYYNVPPDQWSLSSAANGLPLTSTVESPNIMEVIPGSDNNIRSSKST